MRGATLLAAVCITLFKEAVSSTTTHKPERSTYREYDYHKMYAPHTIEPNCTEPEYPPSEEYLRFPYPKTLAEYLDEDDRDLLRGTTEDGGADDFEVLQWKVRDQDYDGMKEYGEAQYDYMKPHKPPYHKSMHTVKLKPTTTPVSRDQDYDGMKEYGEAQYDFMKPHKPSPKETTTHMRRRRNVEDLTESSDMSHAHTTNRGPRVGELVEYDQSSSEEEEEEEEEEEKEEEGEKGKDDEDYNEEHAESEEEYDEMGEAMFNAYNNVSHLANSTARRPPPGLNFSDRLLQILDGVWYIRMPDGNLSKISYQGDGRGAPKSHHYALTEDGLFYKFVNPPIEFIKYLLHLPIRYDQTRLAFDGKFFLARLGRNSPFSKLVKEGLRGYEDGLLHALDERGVWHSFRDTPEMHALKEYLGDLPKTAALFDNHRLTETPNGGWLVKNRIGAYKRMKFGGNCVLFVRGENGVFFKLFNPPAALKKYTTKLPIQIKDPYNIHTSYMLGY